ncbi:hypothetical protein E2C01_096209 [Portunus trituberculatus]|uniref:Uncharacterized protein n=1 Tax=Portunus trituberculatus TaxID=210409 RepID=A0A5B7K1F9_PORTR|nr:hypothetical protein [Portunus trituberculatus]
MFPSTPASCCSSMLGGMVHPSQPNTPYSLYHAAPIVQKCLRFTVREKVKKRNGGVSAAFGVFGIAARR